MQKKMKIKRSDLKAFSFFGQTFSIDFDFLFMALFHSVKSK